jgi:hypothetical protein
MSVVKLNIGGVKFSTSNETLKKYDCFLSNLDPLKKDKDGNIFIDRNGKLFEYILEYLRSDTVPKYEDVDYKQLLVEAEFYKIAPLITILQTEINRHKKIQMEMMN